MTPQPSTTDEDFRAKLIADIKMSEVINLGMEMLSLRVVMVLAIVFDMALFTLAMFETDPVMLALKIIGSAVFSIATWCVVSLRPEGSQE